MTDNDRNTRTLIISFVVAIMVMVPLRFVEVGQGMTTDAEVLGVDSEMVEVTANDLELPYREIEADGCYSQETADMKIETMTSGVDVASLSQEELESLVAEVGRVEARICR